MHNEGLSPPDPFNQSLKKSILWNAVEPGDPYDIKKSMIAKLPGDKKIFLGNKLEIVCLLQAAEIERLALNLEEYKVRLREIEKSELDRHSYEIQIKELASRLQNEELLRGENTKLKNFIDRLNQQLEDSKQKLSVGNNQLNIKYQQALMQIQTITDQNAQLSNETANIRRLLESKTAQYLQAETTIRELQHELSGFTENEGRMSDYEDKFTLLGKEIERLNQVLKGKTAEIQSLNVQLAQSEAFLRSKREENDYLISNQLKFNEEIVALKAELKKTRHEEDQHKTKQYESRLEAYSKEINSLNIRLSNERSQFESQCDGLKAETGQLRSIIQQLETHIQELQQQNEKYEDNSSLIAREIERLNGVLKHKIDQINTLQARNNRLAEQTQYYTQQLALLEKQSAEFKVIHRKMEELEFELSKEQAAKERLAKINTDLVRRQTEIDQSTIEQYEIRVNHLTQDIKRLTDNNIALQNETSSLKQKIAEGQYAEQELRKVSRELMDLKNLMMQEDLGKKNTQERINDLTKKSGEYQKLINELSSEIQRLNEILKVKLQQTAVLENRMQYFTGENHRLSQELKRHAQNEGKIEDYENKFALISLEVQRLNNNLKGKVQQASELEQQVGMLRKENTKLKDAINQINFKSNQNIQEINQQMRRQLYQKDEELSRIRANDAKSAEMQIELQKINQILRQKLQEIKDKDAQMFRMQSECQSLRNELRQAKNKQKEISDLERLNNLLRLKVEEAARWQSSNHELIKKSELLQGNLDAALNQSNSLKKELHQVRNENANLVNQLTEYKDKVNQILREFQRLQQMLQSFRKDNSELKRENYDLKLQLSGGNLKQKNHRLLEEIERLKIIIEQQKEEIRELRLVLSQDHSFEKRIREQLSLIVILCAEIETLRKRVEDKEKEVQDVRRESLVPLKA